MCYLHPISISLESKHLKNKNQTFYKIFSKYFSIYFLSLNISIQTFYQNFDLGFFCFQEPLSLNLRNLNLTKERYIELRNLGFYTFGQLIESLAYEEYNFSPKLKKQRYYLLFKKGLFIIYLYNNMKCIKIVRRRKISVATIQIKVGGVGKIRINNLWIEEFFIDYPNIILTVQRPLRIFRFPIIDVYINVSGRSKTSKSISIQLALSRTLISLQPNIRKLFREYHFFTSDSRHKERRKYGLKKSRKAFQFSKRLNVDQQIL